MTRLLTQSADDDLLDVLRAHAARGGVAGWRQVNGEAFTFDALCGMADRLRRRLLGLQVAAGDVAAVMIDDDAAFVPLLAACAALGGVLLPVRQATPNADVWAIFAHCSPKLVITPS